MILNIKERNIKINDELANAYKEAFLEPLNTDICTIYILNETDPSLLIDGHTLPNGLPMYTDVQLTKIINEYILSELEMFN